MTDNREWMTWTGSKYERAVPVSRLLEAEEERDRAYEALRECVVQSGADTSDGFAHPAALPDRAVREVTRLREESDEDGTELSARVRELEEALRHIVTRLTAADGESVAQGVAAGHTARMLARTALGKADE